MSKSRLFHNHSASANNVPEQANSIQRAYCNLQLMFDICYFQVGGRLLKYSYQAGRVSQWIASKLQSSMVKNMVYPSCSDIPLPFLMGVDHPHMASLPISFLKKGES